MATVKEFYAARAYDRALDVAKGIKPLAFVLWNRFWSAEYQSTKSEFAAWCDLMDETRSPGYDGELP